MSGAFCVGGVLLGAFFQWGVFRTTCLLLLPGMSMSRNTPTPYVAFTSLTRPSMAHPKRFMHPNVNYSNIPCNYGTSRGDSVRFAVHLHAKHGVYLARSKWARNHFAASYWLTTSPISIPNIGSSNVRGKHAMDTLSRFILGRRYNLP